MMDSIAMTAGTTIFGLVSGFVFRLIGESLKASAFRQELAIKALSARDMSADLAAKRGDTGWLRWFFGVAVVAAVVVVPIALVWSGRAELMYPVRSEGWSVLWGLWSGGSKVIFERVGGYPYLPETLQAFNLYISFVVGQKPAK